MNSEAVERIRDAVSFEVYTSRREAKEAHLNTSRKEIGQLAIRSKVPGLSFFQSSCDRFVKNKRADDLHKIALSLSSGEKHVAVFLKTEGALNVLIGYLTGTNTKLQLEATQVLINAACAPENDCVRICQKAGTYLITNIHTDNPHYQNLSAWAMGNLCCKSEEVCRIAQRQGLEVALLSLLSSCEVDVLRSACYALDHYMRGLPDRIGDICSLAGGILVKIFNQKENYMTEIAWCLFVLSTSSESCQQLISHDVVGAVLSCLSYLCSNNIMELSLTTACVRILINCIAESVDVSMKICFDMEKFAQICDFIKKLPCYHLRMELLQCIANLYNVLKNTAEGEIVLEDCNFSHYMKPVILHLESAVLANI